MTTPTGVSYFPKKTGHSLSDWNADYRHSFTLADVPTDALYTGKLTGRVPDKWTKQGWIIAIRDRLKRTNDRVLRRLLRAELRAVEAEAVIRVQSTERTPNP